MVLIVSIHYAASVVFCDGFSNWSKVWGRVEACRSVCLGVSGRKGGKIRRIFEKSSENLVPVFRSWNPRVKIFNDVSQGVQSLRFSVGAWRAFCSRSQIVKRKSLPLSSPGFSSALMLRRCLVWLHISEWVGSGIC